MRRLEHSLVATLLAGVVLCACEEEPALQPTPEVRGKPIASAPVRKNVGASDPKTSETPDTSTLAPEVRLLTGASSLQTPAKAPPVEAPKVVDGYREVKFELLTSYDYEWSQTTGVAEPTDNPEGRIPAPVKELDGTMCFIVGYMQPIDFDRDGVKSFLLTNYPGGCCFGMVPRLNEWIEVEMPGDERVEYSYFDAIKIRGKFEVGEVKSGEVITSLYRMTPDDVEVIEQ